RDRDAVLARLQREVGRRGRLGGLRRRRIVRRLGRLAVRSAVGHSPPSVAGTCGKPRKLTRLLNLVTQVDCLRSSPAVTVNVSETAGADGRGSARMMVAVPPAT